MLTKDFYYNLPPESIAQVPMKPRDYSKLMVLDCENQTISHKKFFDVVNFLKPGDLLVVNNSKVFRARLTAKKDETKFEIFLLRPDGENWIVLARPGKKLSIKDVINFEDDVSAEVVSKKEDGTVVIKFSISHDEVFAYTQKHGSVPVPPYVKEAPDDADDYQTVYAKETGSVAAPTAGFHFTPELMNKLRDKGVNIAHVTLHVGLGTFRPVMTEKVEDHEMHEEWVEVNEETAQMINQTKENRGRVVAVGTTSVRSLEAAAQIPQSRHGGMSPFAKGGIQSFSGFTNLFITPGDEFRVVDVMITNFHLPESTLIMLVSAFAQSKMCGDDEGRKFVLNAYQEAINNEYRFYSFGDAMILF
ncbi:MAG: tRNA preQ1(34) S-adenosylmethionine ribosyltransferase-isomerase QueA [Patescibacteria group bacterium]|nr:tRNA preQ1(34) S-adenosylmethionine ribosyltransferase-isomerase QueA [Patescibacteria group bacterium]